jgi:hypothetical protein
LQRDGYVLDADGRIRGGAAPVVSAGLLANLTDSTVILEHLARIAAAVERDDPAQAIGSAKELIESTAKLVLRERAALFSDADDLPKLLSMTQVALAVHPAGKALGPDGWTR